MILQICVLSAITLTLKNINVYRIFTLQYVSMLCVSIFPLYYFNFVKLYYIVLRRLLFYYCVQPNKSYVNYTTRQMK